MRRGWRITLGVLFVLAVLIGVNALTTGSETKPASATAEDGEILGLQTADIQITDTPARSEEANGSPIVLLHGFAGSLHWWDPLVEPLSAEHRVVRIDLLGHGGSEKPSDGYDMENQAALVAQALTELEVEGATVVGHSMGGLVATALAQTSSQLVDRVVIVNSPATADSADHSFIAKLVGTPVIGQALWRVRIDPMIKDGYESGFAEGFDLEGAFADSDQVVHDNRAMTYTSFDRSGDEADRFLGLGTLPDRLTEALVPVRVIFGERDQLVDADAALDLYSAIPGVEIRRIAEAGHTPQLETPEEVASLILDFAPGAPIPVEPDGGTGAGAGPPKQGGKQGNGRGGQAGGGKGGGSRSGGSKSGGGGSAGKQGSRSNRN